MASGMCIFSQDFLLRVLNNGNFIEIPHLEIPHLEIPHLEIPHLEFLILKFLILKTKLRYLAMYPLYP